MRTFRLPVLVLLVTLVLTGCFQQAGEGLQPTPVGEGPVVAPATATPAQPVEFPTEVMPPTSVLPTQEQAGGMATQVPLPTQAPPPTQPPAVLNTPADQGGQLLQVSPTPPISDAALTATAMIAEALSLQGLPTATPVLQFPTATPILAPPLSEDALIATQMVAGATMTAAWRETAIATASGILPPTFTPTPTSTLFAGQVLPPGSDCVHVVRRGENTFRIALRYGVTIADIGRANGLANPSLISVGQELVIPGCGNLTPTPGAPPGDATSGGLGEGGAGTGGGICGTHLIQPGENLYRIALRYGVTMNALRNANSISSINVIKAGDELVIPCP
ncbi:MAG: hypothetical protein Kow0077_30360 [Anaerolineae bacterium]